MDFIINYEESGKDTKYLIGLRLERKLNFIHSKKKEDRQVRSYTMYTKIFIIPHPSFLSNRGMFVKYPKNVNK